MFFIDFFAEFKSDECQLGKFEHFCISKVNFKVKYNFSTNEARNKSNTSFSCDLTGQSISEIILIILQGEKVNFKGK